uniref:Uncharacterized protein n=1 Tax=viral metagenome TaxID=1070528 RepID=A0A6M3XP93_9ZZZZ
MSLARRIPGTTLILVPKIGSTIKERAYLGRTACRAAWEKQLQPIYPLFAYGGFFSEEELDSALDRATIWWSRRCERIWLCSVAQQDGIPNLGPVSHGILRYNEGTRGGIGWMLGNKRHYSDRGRAAVYLFTEGGDIETLPRETLDDILRCNISTGLLQGEL